MRLVEDSERLVSYDCYWEDPKPVPWVYSAIRPGQLASNIAATILSAVRDCFPVLFSVEWNDALESALNYYGDFEWQLNPDVSDLQGRDAVIVIANGRLIFPNSREALEQAAYCASIAGSSSSRRLHQGKPSSKTHTTA